MVANITVLIPVFQSGATLGRLLDSLHDQDVPLHQVALVVVDGGSTDNTQEVLSSFKQRHGHLFLSIQVLDNPRRTAPSAMNIGLRQIRTPLWVRVDGHSYLASNYLSVCAQTLSENPLYSAVAGQLLTVGAGFWGCAIALAASHSWGVGGGNFRVSSDQVRVVDTAAFALSRTHLLQLTGGFDEQLVRNQDDEFNWRLARHGDIAVTPDTQVYYRSRGTLWGAARQFFQYGLYKPGVILRPGSGIMLRHLVPAAALVWLALTLLLALVVDGRFIVLVFLQPVWVLAMALRGKEPFLTRCAGAIAALVMQWAYGCGFIAGLLLPSKRRLSKQPDIPAIVPNAELQEHTAQIQK